MILDVPYPPSANRMWRYIRKRPILSKEYRDWKERSLFLVLQQDHEKIQEPETVSIDMAVTPPDKRRRDIDNVIKPVLDLLETAEILENDSMVHRLNVYWSKTGKIGAKCQISRISHQ